MIDAHVHLQDERLRRDLEVLLDQCREAGIRHHIVNGTRPEDWAVVAELCRRDPGRRHPSYGVHPWQVNALDDGWEDVLRGYLERGAIGIGEIGLDKWVRDHDLPKQKEIFKRQLGLAVEHELPVTIHCLRAWGHLLEILKAEPLPSHGFLLHSFAGPEEMVSACVDLGGYFSLSGAFFHERKHGALETLLHRVPRDRLLLETDAPDMALPESMLAYEGPTGADEDQAKGINHPGNLTAIYRAVAQRLEISEPELVTQMRQNAVRLFGEPLRVSSI